MSLRRSSSIHGLIVAVVTALLCSMVFKTEISLLRYILASEDDYGITTRYTLQHVGTFAYTLLVALATVLMACGIVKKHHKLVIPWLALCSLAAVLYTFKMWYETISGYSEMDDVLFGFIIMGFEVVVLYPIFVLFADIRSESSASSDEDESMYWQNIQNNSEQYQQQKTIL